MAKGWEPEVEISAQQALELIRAQCPGVDAAKISILGAGWDNIAFLVDDKWVFRFPRRKVAVPLLMNEIRALPKLKSHVPLAIPKMQWFGKWQNDWPFAGYALLNGTTACRASITDEQRTAAAKPLAEFLKALHKIPLKMGEEWGLPDDTIEKLSSEKLIPKIKGLFEELLSMNLLREEETTKLAPIMDLAYRPAEKTAVVHGDFYARHVLVDSHHTVTAVIDWGDIHLGDAAVDLAIAHSFLPPAAHVIFRNAYGHISQRTWLLARLRALYCGATLMVFGHHTQDHSILSEGRRTLSYLQTATSK